MTWEGRSKGEVVTYATMISANYPEGMASYGVYTARLRERKGEPFLAYNYSRQVGIEVLPVGSKPNYRAMAEKHATSDAPAFDFGRE